MLLALMHGLAARPWCYERLQALAGASKVRERVARLCSDDGVRRRVLDLGGGTGAIRPYLPGRWRYICLDLELPKLRRFERRCGDGDALLCDCAQVPLASQSVDIALSMLMSHHLADKVLTAMLKEACRVLRPGGRFIFLDCTDAPDRAVGRFLWRLDRGAHARRPETLLAAIDAAMPVAYHDRFAVWHEYLLVEAVNQPRRQEEEAGVEGQCGESRAKLAAQRPWG